MQIILIEYMNIWKLKFYYTCKSKYCWLNKMEENIEIKKVNLHKGGKREKHKVLYTG